MNDCFKSFSMGDLWISHVSVSRDVIMHFCCFLWRHLGSLTLGFKLKLTEFWQRMFLKKPQKVSDIEECCLGIQRLIQSMGKVFLAQNFRLSQQARAELSGTQISRALFGPGYPYKIVWRTRAPHSIAAACKRSMLSSSLISSSMRNSTSRNSPSAATTSQAIA